jgi:hypothetical protein
MVMVERKKLLLDRDCIQAITAGWARLCLRSSDTTFVSNRNVNRTPPA